MATGSNKGNIKIRQINRYLQCFNTSSTVYAITILPNGNIVSGSADKTIKIWNSTSFELIDTLTGHTKNVWTLAVLPNGNIVSGSWDKTIKLWENINFQQVSNIILNKNDSILDLKFLNNGNLACSFTDKTIKILDMNTFQFSYSFEAHHKSALTLFLLENPDELEENIKN